MSFMTKEQIASERKRMEEMLRSLDEQEKNFEKKNEGLQKLKDLEDKYKNDRIKVCEKYGISEDELVVVNAPKAVFEFPYKDSLGNSKVYSWYRGKIGKAPAAYELMKLEGLDAMMQYATPYGKTWLEDPKNQEAIKTYMTPKKKKETTTVASFQANKEQEEEFS